jgi:pimeloyl-ACP methyl ester carboxylesterase
LIDNELSNQHELALRHPDGRRVYCALFGARDLKKVVFYSHGFPASRIEASVVHREAKGLGLTVIALDRPGFGGSDWYRDRKFNDWARDITLVADHLGIERFSILGISGGTPTAIAAAAALPERVTQLAIVSGVGPLKDKGSLEGMNPVNRAVFSLVARCPRLGSCLVWVIAQIWRTFPKIVPVWFGTLLPKADLEIVKRREVGIVLARNILEALSQGVRGAVSEFKLLTSDWSDLLPQVRVPTTIWHGDADTYVPLVMGESIHQAISGSIFHKVVGGGHFMILDTMSEILEGSY